MISPQGTAYDLTGPAIAPVVVLIHGLGLTRQTWADHLPALSGAYRVLTYDLSGHGETALPVQTPSLTVLADQLRDLMDHLTITSAETLSGWSIANRRLIMPPSEKPIRAARAMCR